MTDRVVGDPGVQRAAATLVATIRRQPEARRQDWASFFQLAAADDDEWKNTDDDPRGQRGFLADLGALIAEISAEEARALAAIDLEGNQS